MKKVLVGGCFNLIHPGHLFFLQKAKEFGDCLIVVVANDNTVIRRKGYLLYPAEKRKKNLEKTGIPDKVVIGDKEDFFKVVKKEKPHIIVLGYDQILEPGLEEKIKKFGCKIIKLHSRLKGYKTRKIIKKKKNQNSSSSSVSSSSKPHSSSSSLSSSSSQSSSQSSS